MKYGDNGFNENENKFEEETEKNAAQQNVNQSDSEVQGANVKNTENGTANGQYMQGRSVDGQQNSVYGTDVQRSNTAGISYDKNRTGEYAWNYNRIPSQPSNIRPRKKSNGLAIFTVIMCVAFLATSIALSAVLIANRNAASDTNIGTEDITDGEDKSQTPVIPFPGTSNANKDAEQVASVVQPGNAVTGELTIPQIATKCKPSAVGIEVTASNGFYTSSGVGSGFIISKDGYIATNNHVVEGADTIKVLLDDKREFDAELIGRDSVTDLAVIKIEADDLPVAELGDSDNVKVGDLAVAIGTPAGIEFAGTVTDGIISAINRDVEITNNYGQVVKTMTLIQTNATINPGNSGGPLINSKGQVIGINTLKLTSRYEGIGFSIPINSAVKIFNQLIENGEVTDRDGSFVTGQGSIGITQYSEVTAREAEYYNIPQGILVIQINRNSSAAAAGLRRGDIITSFCGTPVKTAEEINKEKNKYKAGDEVTISVFRDGEGEFDITFKLDIMNS